MKKKEGYPSSHEKIFYISNARTTNANRIMIFPYGFLFNSKIIDYAKPGDIIQFKDDKCFKLLDKCTVHPHSVYANIISQMIFGKPMRDIFNEWKQKYKQDIYDDTIGIIVYEPTQVDMKKYETKGLSR